MRFAWVFPLLLATQVHAASTQIGVTIVSPASNIPAPAAAAGFTTVALKSDFTKPVASGWLGGCSTPGNGAGVNTSDAAVHDWWMNIWWAWTYQPCATTQVVDPVYGNSALDLPWTVDLSAENVGTTIQSASWFSKDATLGYPNNALYRIRYRITPVARGSWGGMFTWPVLAMTDSTQAGNELDISELDTGNLGASDAAAHNWGLSNKPGQFLWQGFGSPGLPSGFDPTQYHTFDMLSTSDGANMSACSWVDGAFQDCIPIPGGLTPTEAVARSFLIVQNACDFWNYNVPCTAGQVQHMYVTEVSVYSCSSWKTTQCNRPVMNGPF